MTPIFNLMLMFGVLFGVVAALMAAIGLVNALNHRAKDLAVLRILGASRFKIARVALQESLILVHAAVLVGLGLMVGLGMVVGDRMLSYGLLISPWPNWQEVLTLYIGAVMIGILACIVPVVRVAMTGNEEGLKA